MVSPSMMTSNSGEWQTPPALYAQLDNEFHFTVDVCASDSNKLSPLYFTKSDSCLTQPWHNATCWMNPPYGRKIGTFLAKAKHEALVNNALVCCLVPARTDTRWWWDNVWSGEVRFIKGRLKFHLFGEIMTSAPFPSAIVIFHRGLSKRGVFGINGEALA